MNLEELAARVQTLEDTEEIKRLQRIYGYYLDNNMWDEIIDLFSDDTESVEVAEHGVFLGKEGVKKFFWGVMGGGRDEPRSVVGMARVMQLQGVVDIDPGGKTATGRWQGWISGV
jgi:hypothetical protein